MSQVTLSERPYLNSNLFSSHYLDERVRERSEWDCDEAAREAMEELRSLYENERRLVEGYNEDPLIQNWIDEVLEALGFGTQVETTLPGGGGYVDVLCFEDDDARRNAAEIYLSSEDTTDLFEGAVGLVEAKQWDADFTERFSEERPYRNASHQIKHYLERTPGNVQWGILTNGRKWRLYGTKDYETRTYFEVDLPALLERGDLEKFKYFTCSSDPKRSANPAGRRFSIPFDPKARPLRRNSVRTSKTTSLLPYECLGGGSSRRTSWVSIRRTTTRSTNSKNSR